MPVSMGRELWLSREAVSIVVLKHDKLCGEYTINILYTDNDLCE